MKQHIKLKTTNQVLKKVQNRGKNIYAHILSGTFLSNFHK